MGKDWCPQIASATELWQLNKSYGSHSKLSSSDGFVQSSGESQTWMEREEARDRPERHRRLEADLCAIICIIEDCDFTIVFRVVKVQVNDVWMKSFMGIKSYLFLSAITVAVFLVFLRARREPEWLALSPQRKISWFFRRCECKWTVCFSEQTPITLLWYNAGEIMDVSFLEEKKVSDNSLAPNCPKWLHFVHKIWKKVNMPIFFAETLPLHAPLK